MCQPFTCRNALEFRTMGEVPVANVLLLVLAVLTPVLAFWVLVRVPRVVDGIGAYLRRRRAPVPAGPPIERIAADLRRVHRTLVGFPPGTPNVRRLATRAAYDTLLGQACAAVEVTHRLDELPEGVARDLERLRVEEELRRAGLAVT